jgi:hypothetical protein
MSQVCFRSDTLLIFLMFTIGILAYGTNYLQNQKSQKCPKSPKCPKVELKCPPCPKIDLKCPEVKCPTYPRFPGVPRIPPSEYPLIPPSEYPLIPPGKDYNSAMFQQVGFLYKGKGKRDQGDMMPLYGRRLYHNSDRWEYYTINNLLGNNIKIDIYRKGRNINREFYDGDEVSVRGLGKFIVSMYDTNQLVYNPNIF